MNVDRCKVHMRDSAWTSSFMNDRLKAVVMTWQKCSVKVPRCVSG